MPDRTVRFTILACVMLVWALAAPSGAHAQANPYSLEQVVTLLRGGVGPQFILDQIRPDCISFVVDPSAELVLRESGADAEFISGLRSVCSRTVGPEDEATTTPPAPVIFHPARAALMSVLPGGGQFYTRRPVLGVAFLGAAAGVVAMGMLTEDVTVECLQRGGGGSCPADQHGSELERERPYLAASVGVAAAVGVISAVVAYSTAVGVNRAAAREVPAAEPESTTFRVRPPQIALGASGARVELLRIRF